MVLLPYRPLLKHGVFSGETDVARQMLAYIETHNQTAIPVRLGRAPARSSKRGLVSNQMS